MPGGMRNRSAGARGASTPSVDDYLGESESNSDPQDKNSSFVGWFSFGGSSFGGILALLLCVRVLAAFVNPIADCDETFNYWEPTHFLMYGWGMQTWEYSPTYALRSYLYVGAYATLGNALRAVGLEAFGGKRAVFYALRSAMGAASAYCEARFAWSVGGRFGTRIRALTAAFIAASAGTFNAGSSFLPQTFATNFICLSFASFFDGSDARAVLYMGIASLVGWPFCVLVGGLIGLNILYRNGVVQTAIYGVISIVACLVPSLAIDYYFYRRWLFAPVNIALYNSRVNEGEKGGTLYGVEPWDFFGRNLALNFGIAFVMSLIAPVAVLLCRAAGLGWLHPTSSGGIVAFAHVLLPYFGWVILMSSLPHKEERFTYVVYPLLCICAAVGLERAAQLASAIIKPCAPRGSRRVAPLLCAFGVFASALIGASRAASMAVNYGAPLRAYAQLSQRHTEHGGAGRGRRVIGVCLGKEWYRFPSHFVLEDASMRLRYIKSGFGGQLPSWFVEDTPDATSIVPDGFNDLNKEETSRYSDIDECDYIVDLDLPDQQETRWDGAKGWRKIFDAPFLDAAKSPVLTRAFYIPGLSESRNAYGKYQVFERAESTQEGE